MKNSLNKEHFLQKTNEWLKGYKVIIVAMVAMATVDTIATKASIVAAY
jgi:hypothetical protein